MGMIRPWKQGLGYDAVIIYYANYNEQKRTSLATVYHNNKFTCIIMFIRFMYSIGTVARKTGL